ncbi:MAG: Tex family protein [Verrucomicrobiota bacterium]
MDQINATYVQHISSELNIQARQVAAVMVLLEEGATIPFIARYRKERTGSLDEVAIAAIRDRVEKLTELDARRNSIVKSLNERNLMTSDLKRAVEKAETLSALEDIYLPYRPKRRTRATIAREAGLEPLAELLWEQRSEDPEKEAAGYVDTEKKVESVEDALAGARDILAERINDDSQARAKLRELFQQEAILSSKLLKSKEAEAAKFKDYFEWNEPAAKAPSHRILAIRRGEKEGFLMMRVIPSEEVAVKMLERLFVQGDSPCAEQVKLAVKDSYKRLLSTALETELRLDLKSRADEEAIRVFTDNLRELLLASPLGQKTTLAIDPGFRTGCKIVCLDRQGKLLCHDVIYPDKSEFERREAGELIIKLCQHFKVEAVAIGNGTAGRETEAFIKKLKLPKQVAIMMVNESGASIYSASEVARDEFPDLDLTIRGAISIGRRLMDPLAELVKIDAKSIGVGQYQHDVDQNRLKRSLDEVVMSCVNSVGVEVNTASKQLLSYVSGLGPQIAENIIKFRDDNGPFTSRAQLKKVERLGPKAFEQAAGFLRIRDSKNPLDASAVHPERYGLVDRMARDSGCSVGDLIKDSMKQSRIKLEDYVTDDVGLPTLQDIQQELKKPGRDPRAEFELFSFAEGVEQMSDLKEGMRVPGIVTNVTAFGAFVDIGVHQDGLVHISQLSDEFVNDPNDVVKVQDKVYVTVMEVDQERKRIGLSMKSQPDVTARSDSGKKSEDRRPRKQQGRRPRQESNTVNSGNDWFTEAMSNAKKR